MTKQTVAILYGGRSGEHEVSLQSATSICRNIDLEKYDVILVGIDKGGVWYLQSRAMFDAVRRGDADLSISTDRPRVYALPQAGLAAEHTGDLEADIAFPVLHGTFGEDGTVQGYLSVGGLPYVGSDTAGSAIGFDKAIVKSLWNDAGLPVVPFFSVVAPDTTSEPFETFVSRVEARILDEYGGYPVFVKPARGGSSVGVSKANGTNELRKALGDAAGFDFKLIVEPVVRGREIECSVTGNLEPRAWALGEIVPQHEFYDYRSKYVDSDGAALIVPADLPADTRDHVREIAVQAYRAGACHGLARVDFFLEGDRILLNEINTIPGFTSISMFPVLCREHGISYPELIDHVLELSIEHKARLDSLAFDYSERER
ncbi:MAG: D-alanine--D-alanine ligase family protein [Spirochaetales bacterium]